MKFTSWLKKIIIIAVLFFAIDFAISQVLLGGLNKYFGLKSDSKILINGSSLAMAGFDKVKVEKELHQSVAFYTRTGVSLQDRNAMLKHYFNQADAKTDVVVFEVNPLLFSKKFTAENVYMLFLPFIDDSSMDELIQSKTSFKEYLVRKTIRTSRYNSDLITLSTKGYLGDYRNQKNQVLDAEALSGLKKKENTTPVELDVDKIKLFESSMALLNQHSKKIILVNMPIFSTKMKTFKTEDYQKYLEYLNDFRQKNKNVYMLDLNKQDFTEDSNLFADPLHMNVTGQSKTTKALTDYIAQNNFFKK